MAKKGEITEMVIVDELFSFHSFVNWMMTLSISNFSVPRNIFKQSTPISIGHTTELQQAGAGSLPLK